MFILENFSTFFGLEVLTSPGLNTAVDTVLRKVGFSADPALSSEVYIKKNLFNRRPRCEICLKLKNAFNLNT